MACGAIRHQVELRVSGTADRPPETLRPLGLVLEAGAWLLVHLGPDGPKLRPLAGLPTGAETLTLGRGFTRPPDFDLAACWRSLTG